MSIEKELRNILINEATDDPETEELARKTMEELTKTGLLAKKIAMNLLDILDEHSPSWKVLVLSLVERKDFSREELMAILSKYKNGFFDWQIKGAFLAKLCGRNDFSTDELLKMYAELGLDVQIPFSKKLTKRKDIPLGTAKEIFNTHSENKDPELIKYWGDLLSRLICL